MKSIDRNNGKIAKDDNSGTVGLGDIVTVGFVDSEIVTLPSGMLIVCVLLHSLEISKTSTHESNIPSLWTLCQPCA